MKKIGIMGGTFNPIHHGHLILAESTYEQLNLDKILFMPLKNPPHKAISGEVNEKQRVDMISLAIKDNPHFEISTMELDREGITYTAETLTILTRENPDTEYYFIVGADSLFYMQNWMEPQTVFRLCTVVAASRNQVEKDQIYNQMEYLKNIFSANIMLIHMPVIEISSAMIRERVASAKTIRYYVPETVKEYIASNRLYMDNPEVRSI